MVKKAPSAGAGERTRSLHRGGGRKATTTKDPTASEQLIADLQRQLGECRAERDEALEYQTATSDVLNVISRSTTDVQPVLDTVTETAARLCGADAASIAIREGEVYRYVSSTYAPTSAAEAGYWTIVRQRTVVPGRGSVAGQVALEGRIVHVADVRAIPDYTLPETAAAGRRTMLGVPLLRDSEPIGIIILSRKRVAPFSERQVELVRTFADQAVIAMENARLLGELQARTRELEESLEYQTATSDVLKVISRSTFDLQPVLDTLVETAARLCNADMSLMFRREGDRYRGVAFFGLPPAWQEFIANARRQDPNYMASGPGRGSIVSRIFQQGGGVVHVHDVAADPEYERAEAVSLGGLRTVAGVPLLREGQLVGAFTVGRQRVEPFSEPQIELVSTFADQAVIAMENARLLTETREALEQQTATAEVLQVINSSPGDLTPVFDAMLDKAIRLCGAAFGLLSTYDGERFHQVALRQADDAGGEPARFAEYLAVTSNQPGPGSASHRLLSGERLVHISDLSDEEIYRSGDPYRRALVDLGGARTLLAVPLRKDNAFLGVVNIYRQEVRPFSDKQIALLQNFAAQAVIAMENARLITETREALEQQTATAEILRVISGSPTDLQPTFDAIAANATILSGAEAGGIFRFDASLIHFVAHYGWPPDVLEAVQRDFPIPPGRQSTTARAILTREVAHIPDATADPEYALRAVLQTGVRTMLSVPILQDGNPVGAITVTRREVEPFSQRQIDLLKTFADQAVIAIENVRLFNELNARTRDLEESLEYQTATSDVLKVISRSTSDVQPVLDTVIETAARLCGADDASIAIREGEVYRFVASSYSAAEPEAWAILRQQTIVPGRDSIAGRTAFEGRVVHIEDVAADPDYALPEAVAAGLRTGLGVPLLREGEVLGAISLGRNRMQPFAERQIELVRTFADQAVIAMENARLLGELQARTRDLEESLEYQTATSDVLNVISRSTADVQPVLDTVAETAARLCGADTASITIREGEVYRFAASSFSAAEPEFWAALRQRRFVPGRETLAGRVALEGRVVHVEDLATDPDYAVPENVAAGRRTGLGVPLLREGAVLGTIGLGRNRVEPFSDRQIELVRTFADQAVIAIENARLLGELQARTRDLEESLEYQTATSDVLNVISRSTADVQPVLDTLIETATRLCSADGGGITIREGEVYRYVAATPAVAADAEFWETLRQRAIVPGRDSVAGRVALEGRVVHVADVSADPDYALPEAVAAGQRTILGVPLLREGAVLGTINLPRRRVEPFTERQIELVRTFADQAVIAIENARLLSELRQRTRDLEESLEYQTATSDVLNVISRSTADVQPVLDTVAETACRLCGADVGAISIREGEVYRYVSAFALDAEYWAIRRQRTVVPGRETLAGRVLLEGRVVHVADILADPDYSWPENVASGRRTILGVPLLREATVIGTIGLARKRVEPFTERQIELVRTFADQAVIAIENARLLGEIRQRQAELRVTFDNMGDGVAMFDAEQRLAAWNRNFQQLLDLPDALLAARPSIADYIRHLATHGEYGEVDVDAEVRRLLEVAGTQYSTERTRPDGRVVEVRANPVPGGGVVINYSDITERKRAEAEIRAARDAAETALADLRRAQDRLIQSEKMASLGQLTAGIAHEIKNPLNFVNNFAGLSVELLDELKETAAPAIAGLAEDERADVDEIVAMLTGNLEKIAEHGRRADGIVKSMLEHSRGVSGERRAVDLNALVEEALNLAYHGARAQDASFNITLERDLDPAVTPIELAPQEMTRVFLNLFGNGFYAATERARGNGEAGYRPTLQVSTRDLGGDVEIRVRDNGTGIPPEIRDRLFQPFFTTKPTGEGTGLGLSISYDIVTQQHGGSIAVDSEPGEFTEFTIRLPRSRQATMTGKTP